jgi:hypothetical protein
MPAVEELAVLSLLRTAGTLKKEERNRDEQERIG